MTDMNRAKEREWFRALADGSLTEQEFAQLQARLLEDAELRKRYIRAMGVEASLYEAILRHQPLSRPAANSEPRRRWMWSRRRTMFALGWVSVTSIACAALLLSFAGGNKEAPKEDRPQFVSQPLPRQQPVAIVTWVWDTPDTASLKPGTRLGPGLLTIPTGQVQLEFLNGARLAVEGPAELQLVSVSVASLVSGKAVAHVPSGAKGFVLNTPDAAIVDLGTEFAVAINDSSEIQVLNGEVEVSLLGLDGNTLTTRRVREADAVRARRGQLSGIENIASSSLELPKIQALTPRPLDVSKAYVRSVVDSAPIVYWRFEYIEDGLVRNEVGDRWNAVVFDDSAERSGIVVKDGMASFTPIAEPNRRIDASEPIPGINQDSYSIELWVNPNHFHWGTLAALIPTVSSEENLTVDPHLALMELPYQSSLIYVPGSFRFLHRSPPGSTGGINLFTNGDCTPGVWHHLVAVKTPTELKFFLNGRLLRHLTHVSSANDNQDYWMTLGCLYRVGDGRPERPLAGALDEVALYLRPLTDNEVQQHYQAMGE